MSNPIDKEYLLKQLKNYEEKIIKGKYYAKDETYSQTEVDDKLLLKADKTDLNAYTTTDDLNLLLDEKADKTELADKATETFVVEKINEAQLAGTGQQVDLSVYQTKDGIGEITNLTTAEDTIVGAINEINDTKANKVDLDAKADKATDLAGYGITDAYTKAETDANIKVVVDKVGDLTTLTTTAQDSVVNSINELVANKAEKTDLDDFVTLDEVKNEINQAQLGGAGQVDLSIYQTKDEIGAIVDLSTTDKGTIVGAINEVKNLIDNSSETVVVKCWCSSSGFSHLTFDAKDKSFTEIENLIVTEKKTVIVELEDTVTTSKYTLQYRGADNVLEGTSTKTNSHDFYGSAKIDGVEKNIILKFNSDDTATLELHTNRYVQLFVDCASAGGTFGLMGTLDKTFEEISKEFHARNIVEVIAWDNTTTTSCLLSIAYVGENLIKFTGIGDFDGVTKRIILTIDNQNNQNLEAVDIGGGTIEFDDEPLQDSENAVKSGGVYTGLGGKQDKIIGKQGQTVGFDADGNVVAEGTPVTKDQFTFVVNDSQTFNEWIGNDVTNSGDATKYESVYITKGNYTASNTTTQTNGIYYAVNLTKTGTKKVYAESGAKITFVGAYHDNDVVGVGYEQIPSNTENYSVHGLTVRAQIDGVNENGYRVVCFYNMVNITECIAESNCNTKTDGGVRVEGFKNCDSLARCKTTDFVAGFTDGIQPTKKLSSIGFSYCVDLLECESYPSVKENTTATNDVNGYENCVNMVRCIGSSNEKYVVICVAGQSNAVGYDESPIDNGGKLIYTSRNTNRIKQLGFYGDDNLKIIDLGYCAQSMQDMRPNNRPGTVAPGTKGIHLPLANLMLDYIPDDYNILVLPIAYGGTGFTSGNNGTYSEELKKPTDADPKANQGGQGTAILKWGTGTAYYQTLRDRIIHALELNDNNMFAGIIWCQGENDMNNANGHKSGFEAMTQMLFDELNAHNSGALRARTPRGTFDRNIWYNMETVSYWYNQGQCQTIWDNYRAWNEATYVEIPRDTESNDVNGTGATAGIRAKHYGNNAYQKVVAPRVLQKMIDMDTFTKKVNVVEKEIEIPIVTPEITPEAKTHEDERLIADSDVTKRSQGTVLTIDANGNCTANKELRNSYTTDKTHIIFKDFYKMEFKVSRSMYWLVIEQDTDADSVVVVGFGKSYTTRIVQITKGTISQTPIKEADGSKNKTFHKGHRIRIYRETNGNIVIYEKGNSGIWYKWLEISSPNVLKEKVLGFCAGIAANEFSDSFATDDMKLFEDMTIWQASPSSTTREIDMRLTSIERPYDRYAEERDAIAGDIVSQSSGSTFSLNGSKNIVASATIDTTKVQKIYLKDVFKLEFNVNRAIYYLVLRKNSANDDVLVCEIGGSNTGRISTINTANQKTVLVDSTAQYTLEGTDKIRIYRDGNGSVHVYLKKQNNAWGKVATISARHEFDKQLFGFVVGLGTDETNSSIGASDVLLSSLKVWETEPFPLARVFDMRTSN